jgi:hypothetical protein
MGPAIAPYEVILSMIRAAREISSHVYDDLQYLERSYTMMSKHWIEQTADDMLPPLLQQANKAISNYLKWAGTVLNKSEGKGGVFSANQEYLSRTDALFRNASRC